MDAGNHGNAKERAPLTPELQALAEQAWGYVERLVERLEDEWPGLGIPGAVAERIVTLIATYDPEKGASLKTWANSHAIYAAADLKRQEGLAGFRRQYQRAGGGVPHVVSFDRPRASPRSATDRAMDNRTGDSWTFHAFIAEADPLPEWEQLEAARRLLRGLTPDEFASVWDSVIGGKTLKAIGRERGLSESRIAQLKIAALDRLREMGRTA